METFTITSGDTPIKVTAIAADHVSAIVERDVPMVVNTVPVYGRQDFYRWDDDSWRLCPQWAADEYELRRGYGGYCWRADALVTDATDAGTKKFNERLADAITVWAQHNQQALDAAENESRERQASDLDTEALSLREQAARLETEANLILDGGKVYYYIKHFASGHREKRRAIRTVDGETVDTVSQPSNR